MKRYRPPTLTERGNSARGPDYTDGKVSVDGSDSEDSGYYSRSLSATSSRYPPDKGELSYRKFREQHVKQRERPRRAKAGERERLRWKPPPLDEEMLGKLEQPRRSAFVRRKSSSKASSSSSEAPKNDGPQGRELPPPSGFFWNPRFEQPSRLPEGYILQNGPPWGAVPSAWPGPNKYWDPAIPGKKRDIPDPDFNMVGPRPWTTFVTKRLHTNPNEPPPPYCYKEGNRLYMHPPEGYKIQTEPPYHIYKPHPDPGRFWYPWHPNPVLLPRGWVKGAGEFGVVRPRPPGPPGGPPGAPRDGPPAVI